MVKYSILFLVLSILFVSCGDKAEIERLTELNEKLKEENRQLSVDLEIAKISSERIQFLSRKLKGLKARIVTNYGNIELEFFHEKAPITIANFLGRAESGFYDNSQFHRIIPGFMIQAGDPNSKDKDIYNDGLGGTIFNIPHEFNEVSHERGIISMARQSAKGVGAGSQFFIMHATKTHLDGEYTVFGKVTSGMEVVDKIAEVPTNKKDPRLRDRPVNPVIIKRIEVYR